MGWGARSGDKVEARRGDYESTRHQWIEIIRKYDKEHTGRLDISVGFAIGIYELQELDMEDGSVSGSRTGQRMSFQQGKGIRVDRNEGELIKKRKWLKRGFKK